MNTEMSDELITCKSCGGSRVFWFRLDADWGNGGDLTRLNPDEAYFSDDPTTRDEVDLDGKWCMDCGGFTE